jgi:serine/threonine protein kinase
MRLQLNDQIDRYRIIKQLGMGGISESYLSIDTKLERNVVVKIGCLMGDLRSLIADEARIIAQINHKSVITVFDVGWYEDKQYAVYEYLERSLEAELRQASGIAPAQIVSLLKVIADALDYVHRRGFLHRNIKPRKIFWDSAGQPRLSGFDIAVQKDELQSAVAAFTQAYCAPEQLIDNRQEMGDHTDIFGLGVVFYEMLTGKLPFNGADRVNLPIPPREIDPSIPEELERICLKCICTEISNRYSTAEQLARELQSWGKDAVTIRKPRAFISHSAKDREFVEYQIISFLERHGVKTWYSKVNIETASEWQRSILKGLESCEWFILVMSPGAALSEWVKDEVYWAIENRFRRIIPIMIDECDPRIFHIRIARIQHIDFRSDIENAWPKLLNILGCGHTF